MNAGGESKTVEHLEDDESTLYLEECVGARPRCVFGHLLATFVWARSFLQVRLVTKSTSGSGTP